MPDLHNRIKKTEVLLEVGVYGKMHQTLVPYMCLSPVLGTN